MRTTVTLRLPEELCGRIEHEAKRNHLSPKQYILDTLTKTLSYNEAFELVDERLLQASARDITDILKEIPDRKPLPGDEL